MKKTRQQAGNLRHPIDVMGEKNVPDGQGGFETTFEKEETRWANVQPISTAEKADYSKSEMEITHRITTRGPALTSEKKIQFGDRMFDIEGIRNIDEIGAKIEIEAVEIEGDAR
jgi:SPP1 family predicted phage head-tail adaptor